MVHKPGKEQARDMPKTYLSNSVQRFVSLAMRSVVSKRWPTRPFSLKILGEAKRTETPSVIFSRRWAFTQGTDILSLSILREIGIGRSYALSLSFSTSALGLSSITPCILTVAKRVLKRGECTELKSVANLWLGKKTSQNH